MTDDALPAASGAACRNCGTPLAGRYCSGCGQNTVGIDRFFLTLINETLENIFSRDSRPGRTLFYLFFRPGFLTREYFAGRRARYVPPLRLYLVTSLLFFSVLSIEHQFSDTQVVISDEDQETVTLNQDLTTEIDAFNLSFLTPGQNEAVAAWLKARTDKASRLMESDPGSFADYFIDQVPKVMFFLVPLFAVVLKVTYLFPPYYYTEHLILAVHNHSFIFCALVLSTLIESLAQVAGFEVVDQLSNALGLWIIVYLFLSMRRYYGQGYLVTAIKYVWLAFWYFVLFLIGALIALAFGVLTL